MDNTATVSTILDQLLKSPHPQKSGSVMKDENAKIGYEFNANSLRWYIEILAGKFDSI